MSLDENHPTQDTETHAAVEAEPAPQGWGRLLSLHDNASVPIFLTKEVITFGRRSTCDVHVRHPAVSGLHCSIKNCGNGEVILTDESTNGTFVHGLAVGKGKQRKINEGDEIMLIKSASEKIGYKFHLNSEDRAQNEAERKYQFGADLGTGAFAIVKKCVDKSTGAVYAVKIIDKKKFAMQNQTSRDALMDEHKILKKVNHRGVIKVSISHHGLFALAMALAIVLLILPPADAHLMDDFLGAQRPDNATDEALSLAFLFHTRLYFSCISLFIQCHDMIDTRDTLYVVLDLVNGGDLFDRIVAQNGMGFSEAVARDMFQQMLETIDYLHSINIVHRDLKPENVLLVSPDSNEIRISDFGLSRIIRDGSFMKTMCGTPQYIAPEVIVEHNGGARAPKGYDKAVDV